MPLGDKKKDIKYVKMKSRLKVILHHEGDWPLLTACRADF